MKIYLWILITRTWSRIELLDISNDSTISVIYIAHNASIALKIFICIAEFLFDMEQFWILFRVIELSRFNWNYCRNWNSLFNLIPMFDRQKFVCKYEFADLFNVEFWIWWLLYVKVCFFYFLSQLSHNVFWAILTDISFMLSRMHLFLYQVKPKSKLQYIIGPIRSGKRHGVTQFPLHMERGGICIKLSFGVHSAKSSQQQQDTITLENVHAYFCVSNY